MLMVSEIPTPPPLPDTAPPVGTLPGRGRMARLLFLLAAALIVLAGAALRLVLCRGDLLFDEIWSMYHLFYDPRTLCQHWWDVFWRIHHDNNHYLNSLYLWFLGPHQPYWLYRMQSAAFGIATLIAVGVLARRWWGRVEALLGMVLTAASFRLIQFSSEARGYGIMIFFVVLTLILALRWREKPTPGRAVAVGLAILGGLLGHLTFIFAWAGLALWLGWEARQQRRQAPQIVKQAAQLFALPAALLLALVCADLWHLNIGGGPQRTFFNVTGSVADLVLGLPTRGMGTLGLLLVVGLSLAACLGMARTKSSAWIYFAATVLMLPPVSLLAYHPGHLAERYYAVAEFSFLLLLVWLLGRVWRWHPAGKVLVMLAVAAMLTGQITRLAQLMRQGRGQYTQAVRYLFEHTEGPFVEVGANQSYDGKLLLPFYADRLPPAVTQGKSFHYFEWHNWPAGGPEWLVYFAFRPNSTVEDGVSDDAGNVYQYRALFPASPLSGMYLYIFHRVPGLRARSNNPVTGQPQFNPPPPQP